MSKPMSPRSFSTAFDHRNFQKDALETLFNQVYDRLLTIKGDVITLSKFKFTLLPEDEMANHFDNYIHLIRRAISPSREAISYVNSAIGLQSNEFLAYLAQGIEKLNPDHPSFAILTALALSLYPLHLSYDVEHTIPNGFLPLIQFVHGFELQSSSLSVLLSSLLEAFFFHLACVTHHNPKLAYHPDVVELISHAAAHHHARPFSGPLSLHLSGRSFLLRVATIYLQDQFKIAPNLLKTTLLSGQTGSSSKNHPFDIQTIRELSNISMKQGDNGEDSDEHEDSDSDGNHAVVPGDNTHHANTKQQNTSATSFYTPPTPDIISLRMLSNCIQWIASSSLAISPSSSSQVETSSGSSKRSSFYLKLDDISYCLQVILQILTVYPAFDGTPSSLAPYINPVLLPRDDEPGPEGTKVRQLFATHSSIHDLYLACISSWVNIALSIQFHPDLFQHVAVIRDLQQQQSGSANGGNTVDTMSIAFVKILLSFIDTILHSFNQLLKTKSDISRRLNLQHYQHKRLVFYFSGTMPLLAHALDALSTLSVYFPQTAPFVSKYAEAQLSSSAPCIVHGIEIPLHVYFSPEIIYGEPSSITDIISGLYLVFPSVYQTITAQLRPSQQPLISFSTSYSIATLLTMLLLRCGIISPTFDNAQHFSRFLLRSESTSSRSGNDSDHTTRTELLSLPDENTQPTQQQRPGSSILESPQLRTPSLSLLLSEKYLHSSQRFHSPSALLPQLTTILHPLKDPTLQLFLPSQQEKDISYADFSPDTIEQPSGSTSGIASPTATPVDSTTRFRQYLAILISIGTQSQEHLDQSITLITAFITRGLSFWSVPRNQTFSTIDEVLLMLPLLVNLALSPSPDAEVARKRFSHITSLLITLIDRTLAFVFAHTTTLVNTLTLIQQGINKAELSRDAIDWIKLLVSLKAVYIEANHALATIASRWLLTTTPSQTYHDLAFDDDRLSSHSTSRATKSENSFADLPTSPGSDDNSGLVEIDAALVDNRSNDMDINVVVTNPPSSLFAVVPTWKGMRYSHHADLFASNDQLGVKTSLDATYQQVMGLPIVPIDYKIDAILASSDVNAEMLQHLAKCSLPTLSNKSDDHAAECRVCATLDENVRDIFAFITLYRRCCALVFENATRLVHLNTLLTTVAFHIYQLDLTADQRSILDYDGLLHRYTCSALHYTCLGVALSPKTPIISITSAICCDPIWITSLYLMLIIPTSIIGGRLTFVWDQTTEVPLIARSRPFILNLNRRLWMTFLVMQLTSYYSIVVDASCIPTPISLVQQCSGLYRQHKAAHSLTLVTTFDMMAAQIACALTSFSLLSPSLAFPTPNDDGNPANQSIVDPSAELASSLIACGIADLQSTLATISSGLNMHESYSDPMAFVPLAGIMSLDQLQKLTIALVAINPLRPGAELGKIFGVEGQRHHTISHTPVSPLYSPDDLSTLDPALKGGVITSIPKYYPRKYIVQDYLSVSDLRAASPLDQFTQSIDSLVSGIGNTVSHATVTGRGSRSTSGPLKSRDIDLEKDRFVFNPRKFDHYPKRKGSTKSERVYYHQLVDDIGQLKEVELMYILALFQMESLRLRAVSQQASISRPSAPGAPSLTYALSKPLIAVHDYSTDLIIRSVALPACDPDELALKSQYLSKYSITDDTVVSGDDLDIITNETLTLKGLLSPDFIHFFYATKPGMEPGLEQHRSRRGTIARPSVAAISPPVRSMSVSRRPSSVEIEMTSTSSPPQQQQQGVNLHYTPSAGTKTLNDGNPTKSRAKIHQGSRAPVDSRVESATATATTTTAIQQTNAHHYFALSSPCGVHTESTAAPILTITYNTTAPLDYYLDQQIFFDERVPKSLTKRAESLSHHAMIFSRVLDATTNHLALAAFAQLVSVPSRGSVNMAAESIYTHLLLGLISRYERNRYKSWQLLEVLLSMKPVIQLSTSCLLVTLTALHHLSRHIDSNAVLSAPSKAYLPILKANPYNETLHCMLYITSIPQLQVLVHRIYALIRNFALRSITFAYTQGNKHDAVRIFQILSSSPHSYFDNHNQLTQNMLTLAIMPDHISFNPEHQFIEGIIDEEGGILTTPLNATSASGLKTPRPATAVTVNTTTGELMGSGTGVQALFTHCKHGSHGQHTSQNLPMALPIALDVNQTSTSSKSFYHSLQNPNVLVTSQSQYKDSLRAIAPSIAGHRILLPRFSMSRTSAQQDAVNTSSPPSSLFNNPTTFYYYSCLSQHVEVPNDTTASCDYVGWTLTFPFTDNTCLMPFLYSSTYDISLSIPQLTQHVDLRLSSSTSAPASASGNATEHNTLTHEDQSVESKSPTTYLVPENYRHKYQQHPPFVNLNKLPTSTCDDLAFESKAAHHFPYYTSSLFCPPSSVLRHSANKTIYERVRAYQANPYGNVLVYRQSSGASGISGELLNAVQMFGSSSDSLLTTAICDRSLFYVTSFLKQHALLMFTQYNQHRGTPQANTTFSNSDSISRLTRGNLGRRATLLSMQTPLVGLVSDDAHDHHDADDGRFHHTKGMNVQDQDTIIPEIELGGAGIASVPTGGTDQPRSSASSFRKSRQSISQATSHRLSLLSSPATSASGMLLPSTLGTSLSRTPSSHRPLGRSSSTQLRSQRGSVSSGSSASVIDHHITEKINHLSSAELLSQLYTETCQHLALYLDIHRMISFYSIALLRLTAVEKKGSSNIYDISPTPLADSLHGNGHPSSSVKLPSPTQSSSAMGSAANPLLDRLLNPPKYPKDLERKEPAYLASEITRGLDSLSVIANTVHTLTHRATALLILEIEQHQEQIQRQSQQVLRLLDHDYANISSNQHRLRYKSQLLHELENGIAGAHVHPLMVGEANEFFSQIDSIYGADHSANSPTSFIPSVVETSNSNTTGALNAKQSITAGAVNSGQSFSLPTDTFLGASGANSNNATLPVTVENSAALRVGLLSSLVVLPLSILFNTSTAETTVFCFEWLHSSLGHPSSEIFALSSHGFKLMFTETVAKRWGLFSAQPPSLYLNSTTNTMYSEEQNSVLHEINKIIAENDKHTSRVTGSHVQYPIILDDTTVGSPSTMVLSNSPTPIDTNELHPTHFIDHIDFIANSIESTSLTIVITKLLPQYNAPVPPAALSLCASPMMPYVHQKLLTFLAESQHVHLASSSLYLSPNVMDSSSTPHHVTSHPVPDLVGAVLYVSLLDPSIVRNDECSLQARILLLNLSLQHCYRSAAVLHRSILALTLNIAMPSQSHQHTTHYGGSDPLNTPSKYHISMNHNESDEIAPCDTDTLCEHEDRLFKFIQMESHYHSRARVATAADALSLYRGHRYGVPYPRRGVEAFSTAPTTLPLSSQKATIGNGPLGSSSMQPSEREVIGKSTMFLHELRLRTLSLLLMTFALSPPLPPPTLGFRSMLTTYAHHDLLTLPVDIVTILPSGKSSMLGVTGSNVARSTAISFYDTYSYAKLSSSSARPPLTIEVQMRPTIYSIVAMCDALQYIEPQLDIVLTELYRLTVRNTRVPEQYYRCKLHHHIQSKSNQAYPHGFGVTLSYFYHHCFSDGHVTSIGSIDSATYLIPEYASYIAHRMNSTSPLPSPMSIVPPRLWVPLPNISSLAAIRELSLILFAQHLDVCALWYDPILTVTSEQDKSKVFQPLPVGVIAPQSQTQNTTTLISKSVVTAITTTTTTSDVLANGGYGRPNRGGFTSLFGCFGKLNDIRSSIANSMVTLPLMQHPFSLKLTMSEGYGDAKSGGPHKVVTITSHAFTTPPLPRGLPINAKPVSTLYKSHLSTSGDDSTGQQGSGGDRGTGTPSQQHKRDGTSNTLVTRNTLCGVPLLALHNPVFPSFYNKSMDQNEPFYAQIRPRPRGATWDDKTMSDRHTIWSSPVWQSRLLFTWDVCPQLMLGIVGRFSHMKTLATLASRFLHFQPHLVLQFPDALQYMFPEPLLSSLAIPTGQYLLPPLQAFYNPLCTTLGAPLPSVATDHIVMKLQQYLPYFAPCSVSQALTFLCEPYCYHYPIARYAVASLTHHNGSEVWSCLPQLLQLTRFDSFNTITQLLIRAAGVSVTAASIIAESCESEIACATTVDTVEDDHPHLPSLLDEPECTFTEVEESGQTITKVQWRENYFFETDGDAETDEQLAHAMKTTSPLSSQTPDGRYRVEYVNPGQDRPTTPSGNGGGLITVPQSVVTAALQFAAAESKSIEYSCYHAHTLSRQQSTDTVAHHDAFPEVSTTSSFVRLMQFIMYSAISHLTPQECTTYMNQRAWIREITTLSGKLLAVPKPKRRVALQEALRNLRLRPGVYLPTMPNARIIAVVPENARTLQSAARVPILVPFVVEPINVLDQSPSSSSTTTTTSSSSSSKHINTALIFKSHDDIRQDSLSLQIISLCKTILIQSGVNLDLYPYSVLPNSIDNVPGGVIEVIANSASRDELGKATGLSLRNYFIQTFGGPSTSSFQTAQRNFITSLAGYAIVSYILQVKDRHNGNIMINNEGRLIHIDFGFIFDISPAGDMKFERASFKLTAEMVELICDTTNYNDMFSSPLYVWFVQSILRGFLAIRRQILDLVSLSVPMVSSTLKCFKGRIKHFQSDSILRLYDRLYPLDNDYVASKKMFNLIQQANNNWRTRGYDWIQMKQNMIFYYKGSSERDEQIRVKEYGNLYQ